MKSKVIALLETRTGAQLAELIARRGGIPLWAPALEEVPDIDLKALKASLEGWEREPFDVALFQTGVGTRALFGAAETLESSPLLKALLARATVAVRGPKPTAELNARAVRIDLRAASPFTTEQLLAALSGLDLERRRVMVQRYGADNRRLRAALEARGARVDEITTYRWALPADTRPLTELLDALAARRVDALVFTSAVQAHHLREIAVRARRAETLPALLAGVCVASIGPVCSRALVEIGLTPSIEADPPKLGFLVAALERYFDQR